MTVTLTDTNDPAFGMVWTNRTVDANSAKEFVKEWKPSEGKHELVVNVTGEITDSVSRSLDIQKAPPESQLWLVIPLAGAVGLAFAGIMTWWVLKQDTGTPEMRKISDAIKEGAEAFLKTQYTTIWAIAIIVAGIFFVAIWLGTGKLQQGWMTALAFVLGAACSSVAGFIGMMVSIRANIRTASAARTSLDRAIKVALRGGAVSGFSVVAMSLLGVAGIYYGYGIIGGDPRATPLLIVGFGFGASFVALFAQLGGGIYTKAADVGADLVGKVEKDIPEDDPRNAAVIADLVGDNVGDCAGRGADLFESTAAENIGAMILGIALFPVLGINGIMFPLVARSFGLFATIVGVLVVSTKEDGDASTVANCGTGVPRSGSGTKPWQSLPALAGPVNGSSLTISRTPTSFSPGTTAISRT